jgi:hypothetical protein
VTGTPSGNCGSSEELSKMSSGCIRSECYFLIKTRENDKCLLLVRKIPRYPKRKLCCIVVDKFMKYACMLK